MIIQGDALTELKRLPNDSVDCCVTSPPYWGLRDYKLPPSIWGGDPNHAHAWGPEASKGGPAGAQGHNSQFVGRSAYEEGENTTRGASQGSWCECGAWLGCLGLEPTTPLYIEHIVTVFREVRRVLNPRGTLWLNMGDSYCSDAGKDRVPTTLAGPRVPAGWTNRAQPHRVHAIRKSTNPRSAPERIDTYRVAGLKPKDLCMMPARVAIALQDDGWYFRSDIIWHKTNPMPESVQDRPTKAHEYLFLLAKSERYFYDAKAIAEPAVSDHSSGNKQRKLADGSDSRLNTHLGRGVPWNKEGPHSRMFVSRDPAHAHEYDGKNRKTGRSAQHRLHLNTINARQETGEQDLCFGATRNRRSVWTLSTKPFKGAHFATFPPKLIEPCIRAGCPKGGVVLDPFAGAFTTGLVAQQQGRDFIMIELNPEYVEMGRARLGLEHKEAIA